MVDLNYKSVNPSEREEDISFSAHLRNIWNEGLAHNLNDSVVWGATIQPDNEHTFIQRYYQSPARPQSLIERYLEYRDSIFSDYKIDPNSCDYHKGFTTEEIVGYEWKVNDDDMDALRQHLVGRT